MQSTKMIATMFFNRWVADPAGAMLMVAPDVIYTLNVSRDAVQIGGITTGWDAVKAKMLGLRHIFDYCVYRPQILAVAGTVVRSRIELVLRHRPSGEVLSFGVRNVMAIREGAIVRVDEYVDAALVEAFMRFVSSAEPRESAAAAAMAVPPVREDAFTRQVSWYATQRATRASRASGAGRWTGLTAVPHVRSAKRSVPSRN